MKSKLLALFGALALLAGLIAPNPAIAQSVVSGKVTTAAPSYTTGTAGALSLDTSGGMRVNCTAGCAGSGNSSAQATTAAPSYVNATSNPLSMDLSGGLRVNCTTGCAGSGNSNAQATTAAPSYTNATSNPLSQDLSGNLRTTNGNITDGTQKTQIVDSGGTPISQVSNALNVNVAKINGVTTTMGNGVAGTGVQRVAISADNTAFSVNANAVPLAAPATTSFHLIAAATNNSTLVSSAAGHAVFEISTGNNSANIAYLKLYDKATAPTCGTDTPIGTYIIPGAASGGAGSNVVIPLGKAVTLGLGICVVAGIADADNTAVAASAYAINLTYK